jgi:hypothetical protein
MANPALAVQVVATPKITIQVIDVGATVLLPLLSATIVQIVDVGPQGAQGPAGTPGGGSSVNIVTYEFTSTTEAAQTIPMVDTVLAGLSLFINGLFQSPSGYTISSNSLEIPAELLWVGAECVFQYLSETT